KGQLQDCERPQVRQILDFAKAACLLIVGQRPGPNPPVCPKRSAEKPGPAVVRLVVDGPRHVGFRAREVTQEGMTSRMENVANELIGWRNAADEGSGFPDEEQKLEEVVIALAGISILEGAIRHRAKEIEASIVRLREPAPGLDLVAATEVRHCPER